VTVSLEKSELQSLTELFAEFRDWLQAGQRLRERIDEFLNVVAENHLTDWNPNNIHWEQAEGLKGVYERAEKPSQPNRDWDLMVKDLNKHGGKVTRGGYFYWLFTNGDRVGRKPRRK